MSSSPAAPGTLVVGLMSGTSADGIDAAIVRMGPGRPPTELVHFLSVPYTAAQRRRILALQRPDAPLAEVCALDVEAGGWFADAALELMRAAGVSPRDVAAIGSHGLTLAHHPRGVDGAGPGFTLQVGSAAVLAERTGVDVVADLRSRDVAAGGEGAPLVPVFDYACFASDREARVSLNIGGIANITVIGAGASPAGCLGFDTGPGNMLLDLAVEHLSGAERWFDEDGAWAAQGQVVPELLDRWLEHPYYRRPPPKTTGREMFGHAYALPLVEDARARGVAPADILRTLTALVATTIAEATLSVVDGPFTMIGAGGGMRNPTLRRELELRLKGRPLVVSDEFGVPSRAKEAMAFAFLAWRHIRRESGNLPRVTGAKGPRVLGSLTPGAREGGTDDGRQR